MGKKSRLKKSRRENDKPAYIPFYKKPLVIGVSAGLLLLSAAGIGYAISAYDGNINDSSHVIAVDPASESSSLKTLDTLLTHEFLLEYRVESTLNRLDNNDFIYNLDKYTSFLTNKLKNEGLWAKVDQLEFSEFVEGSWAIPFSKADEGFVKSAETITKNSIDDFFEFYHDFILRSKYKIIVPQSPSEITQPIIDGKLAIYFVKETGSFEECKYILHLKDGGVLDAYVPAIGKAYAEAKTIVVYKFESEGNVRVIKRVNPTVVSSDKKDVALVENGPIETLHSIVSDARIKYIEDELSKYTIGKTNLPYDVISSTEEKWLKREEHVIHTIASIWLLDYANRTNVISEEDAQKRIELYRSNDKYKFVPDLLAQFKDKAGAERLLKMYMTQPDKLFEPYGL